MAKAVSQWSRVVGAGGGGADARKRKKTTKQHPRLCGGRLRGRDGDEWSREVPAERGRGVWQGIKARTKHLGWMNLGGWMDGWIDGRTAW